MVKQENPTQDAKMLNTDLPTASENSLKLHTKDIREDFKKNKNLKGLNQ